MSKVSAKTKNLTLSSIFVALGVILLYLGSIFPVLDLTLAAIASMMIYVSVIEMKGFYPHLIYGATGLLSLLILPDKYIAVVYVLFLGLYPSFKKEFEKLHPLWQWILKLSFFNTALLLVIAVTVYVLHTEDTGLGFEILVLLIANVAFVLYDFAISRLITLYLFRVRRLFGFSDYFPNPGVGNSDSKKG